MKLKDVLTETLDWNVSWRDNPEDDEQYRRLYPGYEEDLIMFAKALKKVDAPENSEEWLDRYEELSRELAARYGMPADHAMRNLQNVFHGRSMWATSDGGSKG